MDLKNTPALAPPIGVVPNFTNPESRANAFTIVGSIFLTLMLLVFIMRMYANLWIKRKVGADDVACILATAGAICYTSMIFSLKSVIGKHQWDLPVSAFTDRYLQVAGVGFGMIYGPIIFCAKLSLFLLYLRLFSPSRRTRYLIYFGIIANAIVYLSITAAIGALCIPKHGQSWLEAVLAPRCINNGTLTGFVYGVFNVLGDIYLFFIPLSVVWQLQLPRKKKLGIYSVFAIGLLACVASVIGLYYRIHFYKDPDTTWNIVPLDCIVVIELNLGIICSCVPYAPTLYRNHEFGLLSSILRRIRSRTGRKRTFATNSSTVFGDDSLRDHPFIELPGVHVLDRHEEVPKR